MMPLEKISIQPIRLKNQKPTEVRECFIELFSTHFRFRMSFIAEEPVDTEDESLGWKDGVRNDYDIVCLKSQVAGIEKSLTADEKWGVYIFCPVFPDHVRVYFRTEAPAQQLFDKLNNWILNGL